MEQPFQLPSPCRQALTLYLPSLLDQYKALFIIKLATKHLEKFSLIMPIQNLCSDCSIYNSSIRRRDFIILRAVVRQSTSQKIRNLVEYQYK